MGLTPLTVTFFFTMRLIMVSAPPPHLRGDLIIRRFNFKGEKKFLLKLRGD